MRRAPWLLVTISFCCLTGCVPLFYAYPTVSYVPAVNVGKLRDKTYAFRVDIADRKSGDESAEAGRYVLRQIHVAKSGYVAGQAKVSMDSGFYWNCFVKCFDERTNHTVRLRFYRPGFNLVEVHAWQTEADLVWREQPGPAEREKALDRLLGPSEPGSKPSSEADWGFSRLAAGSVSFDHRCALLFAAAEYERVAERSLREESDELSDRCLAKAKWLRDHAGN